MTLTHEQLATLGAGLAVGFRQSARAIGMDDLSELLGCLSFGATLLAFGEKGRELVDLDRLAREEMARAEQSCGFRAMRRSAEILAQPHPLEARLEREEARDVMVMQAESFCLEIEEENGMARSDTLRALLIAMICLVSAEKLEMPLAWNCEKIRTGIARKVALWRNEIAAFAARKSGYNA